MEIQLKSNNNTTALRDIKFGEAFKHGGSTWIRIYNEEHDENLGNTASVVNLNNGVEAERPWETIVEPISGTFVETDAELENSNTANTPELLDLREHVETLRETVQNYKNTNSELEKQNNDFLSLLVQITDIVYSDVNHISAEILVLRPDELLDKLKTAVTLSKQSKTLSEDTQIAELEKRIKSLSDSLSDFQSSNAVNLTRAEEYSQRLGECQFINAKLRDVKEKLVLEMAEINKKLQICETANEHLRAELNDINNNNVTSTRYLTDPLLLHPVELDKLDKLIAPLGLSVEDTAYATVEQLITDLVDSGVHFMDLAKKSINDANRIIDANDTLKEKLHKTEEQSNNIQNMLTSLCELLGFTDRTVDDCIREQDAITICCKDLVNGQCELNTVKALLDDVRKINKQLQTDNDTLRNKLAEYRNKKTVTDDATQLLTKIIDIVYGNELYSCTEAVINNPERLLTKLKKLMTEYDTKINKIPFVSLNALFDFTDELVKRINDILAPIDRKLSDWDITTVESLLRMVVSVAVDLKHKMLDLQSQSTNRLLSEDIADIEKELFNAGIDIKIHKGDDVNTIHHLVKELVEREKKYEQLMREANPIPDSLKKTS